MSLDWKNIDQWDAGEISLLVLIIFLLGLLFIMLICIIYYGRIYHQLKRAEGKPLYEGDGPYNPTHKPQRYDTRDDTSEDESNTDQYDEEHNINMSNKAFQNVNKLQPQNHNANLLRYNTNTTNRASSLYSTELHTDEESVDSMARLKYIHGVDDDDEDMNAHQQYNNNHMPQYQYLNGGHHSHLQMPYQPGINESAFNVSDSSSRIKTYSTNAS